MRQSGCAALAALTANRFTAMLIESTFPYCWAASLSDCANAFALGAIAGGAAIAPPMVIAGAGGARFGDSAAAVASLFSAGGGGAAFIAIAPALVAGCALWAGGAPAGTAIADDFATEDETVGDAACVEMHRATAQAVERGPGNRLGLTRSGGNFSCAPPDKISADQQQHRRRAQPRQWPSPLDPSGAQAPLVPAVSSAALLARKTIPAVGNRAK
jgi:hypothetical protein